MMSLCTPFSSVCITSPRYKNYDKSVSQILTKYKFYTVWCFAKHQRLLLSNTKKSAYWNDKVHCVTESHCHKETAKCLLIDLILIYAVFQNLFRSVSPPPSIYLNFFQLYGAHLFPLCFALWGNSVHQQQSQKLTIFSIYPVSFE